MLTTIPVPETINDFTVLESRPLRDREGHDPGHVVLCDRGPGVEHERFVSWVVSTPDDGRTWNAVWGNYMSDLGDALEDFRARNW